MSLILLLEAPRMLPRRLVFLFLSLVCGFGPIACVPSPERAGRKPGPAPCALIVTDDDIPSGSATAGAMYTDNNSLGRSLLTADVVATVEAFRAAGVQCVDVVDSHCGAVDPAPLETLGVRLLTPSGSESWTWPFLGPMDRDYLFAALIGFHSDAGQNGFRPHTINDWIAGLRVDGFEAGEVTHLFLGLHAFGTRVVLVTGDMNATTQARRLSPEVGVVTVRWLDSESEPRFLDSAAASERIRVEVSRALQETTIKPAADKPIAIEISATNTRLMTARSAGIGEAWTQTFEARGFDPKRFPAPAFSIRGSWLSWQAPDPLTAFVGIAFVASYLKGADNWDLVSSGYEAFVEGNHAKAIQAYEKALQVNVYDTATRCRLAAVHLAAGDLERARDLFEFGVEHLDEVGDKAIQSWCAMGLAESEAALGAIDAARDAAKIVLTLPDVGGRHAKAKKMLAGGSLDTSLLPLCQRILSDDESVIPELEAHPLVLKMAAGMRSQVAYEPEEFAQAAFVNKADSRFSWDRFRRNKKYVEPFVAAIKARRGEIVASALAVATEFLPDGPDPSEVRLNLVCGSPWDAFVLEFEGPEVFFDLGYYADAQVEKSIPEFEAILTHELWHQALLRHQRLVWKKDYRKTGSVASKFLYRMLNEGVGHYYSLRSKLYPQPKWADFAEREKRAFELLSKNYPKYLGETDEKRRDEILWRSHAGVPFWEKWSAVPGALMVYRLKSVVGKKGLQNLLAREPFSVFIEYDRQCRKHPRWSRLPKRLVRDARAELNER